MEIKRGDIYLVNFDPALGSEQAGYRPAVIIQNDIGNRFNDTVIIMAITTSANRNYPFLVKLQSGEGGLKKDSMANASQLLTVEKSRLIRYLGSLSGNKMKQINRALAISLVLTYDTE